MFVKVFQSTDFSEAFSHCFMLKVRSVLCVFPDGGCNKGNRRHQGQG